MFLGVQIPPAERFQVNVIESADYKHVNRVPDSVKLEFVSVLHS